jgi:hypothetical protein
MLLVQDSCYGVGVFWKKAEVELGVAVLHHAAQSTRRVDAAFRVIDGTAIAAHTTDVAFVALVFGNQLFTNFEIGIFEQGVLLRIGEVRTGPQSQEQKLFHAMSPRYFSCNSSGNNTL